MTLMYGTSIGDISHIPIIAGPTASGKTSLSLALAQRIDSDILSCDSMQIYKEMNIGTAKADAEERAKVTHKLIDIVEPTSSFSVADYMQLAYAEIKQSLSNGKLPIFCGGTGQYISALYEGISFSEIEISDEVRRAVIKFYESDDGKSAYEELCRVDPDSADKIHPNNAKRVIRALEFFRQSQVPISQHNAISKKDGPRYPFKVFVIDIDRILLYERIDARVDKMLTLGLVEEVRALLDRYGELSITASQAIGYKEIISHFNGEMSLESAVNLIKQRSRNYAKRQMTWYRKIPNAIWVKPDQLENILDSICLDFA